VTHAIGLKFGVELALAVVIEMVDTAAAIGGNNPELRGIGFDQSGHERTPASFKMAKNPHFVVEPFLGLGTAKSLIDASVPADPDKGPESVFDLIHDKGNMPCLQEKGAIFSPEVARFILPARLA
jgi:hypothetical protein